MAVYMWFLAATKPDLERPAHDGAPSSDQRCNLRYASFCMWKVWSIVIIYVGICIDWSYRDWFWWTRSISTTFAFDVGICIYILSIRRLHRKGPHIPNMTKPNEVRDLKPCTQALIVIRIGQRAPHDAVTHPTELCEKPTSTWLGARTAWVREIGHSTWSWCQDATILNLCDGGR